ncbi:MAG: PEP-CTERM sorting domain-containing protein [Phycisphaerae bacterium]
MEARRVFGGAAVVACVWLWASPAWAGVGDSYRRQTLVNDSDSNANDLHIEFTSGVDQAKLRPKAQPPGHDGDGAVDSASGSRLVDWPPPDSFGTVGPGGVAYLDYGYSGHKPVADPDKSYWTYDGNALPGYRMQGISMALRWSDFETATATFRNDLETPQQVQNVQLYKNNDPLLQTIDTYFLPSGPPVGGLPTEFLLAPGEERERPFGPVLRGTYLLGMAESSTAGDPTEDPQPSFLAGPSEPPARLTYDCVTGGLMIDTWGNALNGFIIHSPQGAFTGLAIRPPGFLFESSTPQFLAAQFVDPCAGVPLEGLHHFGEHVADAAMLWDPAEGRWDLDNWRFTYTLDGLPGERGGEIDIISYLPGDVDFDGDVDPWDIQAILAANSYENGFGWGWESGDFDGDTDVDWRDIRMILDHDMYGPGLKDALVSMVPEPATLCLLALGALAAVRRRRG